MRLWPKTKGRGWYGPFDLVEDVTSPIEDAASWATKDRAYFDWLKDKGSDIEKSTVGSKILSASPSVGMSYGDEGLQAQAGLNRAQGGPSVTVGQGQAGQAGQADQGVNWGGLFTSLLPVLAQAGGTYMQYGREEKDRERMKEAQETAALKSAMAGRNVAPIYTPSKVSGWEKLANIGGQALQMGQQQRSLADQAKLRDLQIEAAQGNVAAQADLAKKRGLELRAEEATDAARAAYYGGPPPPEGDSLQAAPLETQRLDQQGDIQKPESFRAITGYGQSPQPPETQRLDPQLGDLPESFQAIRGYGQPPQPPETQPAETPALPVDPTADFTDRQRGIYEEEFSRLGNVQTKVEGLLEAQRAQREMLQGRGMAAQQQQAKAQDTGPGEGDYVVGGGEVVTVEAPKIPLTPYQAIGLAEEERENLAGIISYANAMAKSGGVLSSKEKASIESAMRKDFNNHKAAKNYFDRAPAYEQIKILATNRDAVNPRTGERFKSQGARDLGLVFSFMKLLDPPSTVRESEAASAENAGGVPDKWRNLWNKMLEGQRLAENVREEILFVAEGVYKTAELPFSQLSELYQGVASRTGADFENIGLNPYSHLQKTEGGGADQATGADAGMLSFFEKVAAGDQEALRIFKQLSPYLE